VNLDQLLAVLWRRKVSFLLALVLGIAAVTAVTLVLPRTYVATATLYVGGRLDPEAFVDTQLLEQHTRTYSTLAGNPSVADEVRGRLVQPMSRQELLDRMSFAPVERTQLLLISAEGDSPREAQSIANVYANLFVDRMSTLFEEGRAPAEVAVSAPALEPDDAARPNPPLYLGFGTLLSLFLALGVVLLRERLDTRVRVGPHDDAVLGQPVMSRIPGMGQSEKRRRDVLDRFGVLKTNLDFFDEDPARVIVVTSPGVGEGKTTIASNLAIACATDGERTVLIEADLRRPGLTEEVLGTAVKRSTVGLSNYLIGAVSEQDILKTHPGHPDLQIIWAGLTPPNPAALLGSQRLDALLESLRLDHDRIVIDTCPISVGADASVIASRADGALYVVDEQKTKRAEAQAGLNQLRGVRARLLGIVLNRSAAGGGEGYDYYYGESRTARRRRSRSRQRRGGPDSQP
jgi:capsular exopolysaccharide synthesis family protein